MKKILTIDDFIVAGISGIGYGLGFKIPQILGYEEWQCVIICLIVGMVLDKLANAVVFNKFVQSSKTNRILTFAGYILFGLAIEQAFASWQDISIDDYAIEGYAYLVVPAILGFAFSMIVRWYRVRKIRETYGDGSNGFVFDDLLKRQDLIDEFNNMQNQPISGAYDESLSVKTKNGVFVGYKENDSMYFCGIPYAKPPVGKLRWKAPEPLPESDDVFEAKYFGASSVQVDYEGSVMQHHRQSEDCLYLNICIENKKFAKKNPVIVIFHHGDFSFGGSVDPILYGTRFSKIYPNSVLVTFNYRLGLLGFIDFSEVEGGENYPDAINLGLLDQIAALKWIKENISEFGGDPNNVTVMGFESGALSLSLLAACEKAKGLFQKAFIFNGSPLAAYATPEVSRTLAKKLLEETSTKNMEELLKISTEKLKEVTQKLSADLSAPTRDDKFFPIDFESAYKNGSAEGVEFIIGIAPNESQVYKSHVGKEKLADFIDKEIIDGLKYFDAINPDGAQAVRDYIKEQTDKTSELEAKTKVFDQSYVLINYSCAQQLAASGCKVRLLYWDVKPLIEKLGSGTIDVLAAFLENREAAQMYGNVINQDIAEPLQNLFRKFESGDAMKLFNNEIKGIGEIDWKEFPLALVVSDKKFRCEPIVDRLTEIKELLKLIE